MTNTALTSNEVKECPICHSWCFTDMEVCYGCLHDFTKNQQRDQPQETSGNHQFDQHCDRQNETSENHQLDQQQETKENRHHYQQPVTRTNPKRAMISGQCHTQQQVLPLEQENKTPQPFGLSSGQRLEVVVSFRVVDA